MTGRSCPHPREHVPSFPNFSPQPSFHFTAQDVSSRRHDPAVLERHPRGAGASGRPVRVAEGAGASLLVTVIAARPRGRGAAGAGRGLLVRVSHGHQFSLLGTLGRDRRVACLPDVG